MRVVIDTNILINAANDDSSYAFRIIKEIIDGRIKAFATHQTMSENRQMLRKLVRDKNFREILEEFFRKLNIVKVNRKLDIAQDEEDDKLFESAVSASADYLISEDRGVLEIGEYGKTKVVTAKDFWTLYKNADDDSAWNDWGKMLMGK